jgi:hypothetical protein
MIILTGCFYQTATEPVAVDRIHPQVSPYSQTVQLRGGLHDLGNAQRLEDFVSQPIKS